MQIIGVKTHFNLETDYFLTHNNFTKLKSVALNGRFEDENNETSTYTIWSTETQSFFVHILNHNHVLEHYVYRCSLITLI